MAGPVLETAPSTQASKAEQGLDAPQSVTKHTDPLTAASLLFEPKPEPKVEAVVAGVTKADITTDHTALRHNNLATSTGTAAGVATVATTTTVTNDTARQNELHEHMITLTAKKKTALDAELERFLQAHPGLCAQLQVEQAIAMLRNAQEAQGKQGLSQHALAAALDRVATNLKGDQLPIELVIPQAVADLYKLFEVAAAECEVEPEIAKEIIFLSLFDPLDKALERNVKFLAARAERLAKRAREAEVSQQTPTEIKPVVSNDNNQTAKAAQAQRLLHEGGTAQLEAQRQRKYDQEKLAQKQQCDELAELTRQLAREKAKDERSVQSWVVAEHTQTLTTAMQRLNESDLAANPATAAANRAVRETFVQQSLVRNEFEQVAKVLYQLAYQESAIKGTAAVKNAGAELQVYLKQQAHVLVRMPGGSEKVSEIVALAQSEGDKARQRIERAADTIKGTSWDNDILRTLQGLSDSDRFFLKTIYQERTGKLLAQDLQSKMSGNEETLALDYAASNRRALNIPDSLMLTELSRVDIDAITALTNPRTAPEQIVAIQQHLQSGRATEAALLLSQGNFTTESLARVEQAHGLPSTEALLRRNEILSQALEYRLSKGEMLLPEHIEIIGSAELESLARSIGQAQAGTREEREKVAERTRLIEERRTILSILDHRFRNPDLTARLSAETERARRETTVASVASYSSQVGFFDRYRDDKSSGGSKRGTSDRARAELNQYLADNTDYIKNAPDLQQHVEKAKVSGSQIGIERSKAANAVYNLINESKDKELLQALRQGLFEQDSPHLAEDLRAVARMNQTSLEQIVEKNFDINSLKGIEARALLRGDLVDAAAVRLAAALQSKSTEDVAGLYATISQQGGKEYFSKVEQRFNERYAREVTYRVYDGESYTTHEHASSRIEHCTSLDDAIKRSLDATGQVAVAAAREGDRATLDAIALYDSFWGTFSYHPDSAVKHLETFRTQLGELDLRRIQACTAQLQALYGTSAPKAVAALIGTDARTGNSYAQLRALASGNEAEFLLQKTLSRDYDQMLAAMEKPQQLVALEKLVNDADKLNSLGFKSIEAEGTVVKSADQQRDEFVALVNAASKRWSDNRAELERRVQETTKLSLADFHNEALTPTSFDPYTGATLRGPIDKMEGALLSGVRDGHGELTDAMKLWRNMKGAGTTSEREIIDIVRVAVAEGRFEAVDKEFKDLTGVTFQEWINDKRAFWVRELEGDDRFWVEYALKGPPKDVNDARERAAMLTNYTESASWVKALPGFTDQKTSESFTDLLHPGLLGSGAARSNAVAGFMNMWVADAAREYVDAKGAAEKAFSGYHAGAPLSAEQISAVERLEKATQSFLDRRNSVSETIVDGATMVVVVVGGTVIVVASGGIGAAVILTGVAGASRMAGKQYLMGDSYGRDSVALDLGKSGIDLVTLGVSTKIPVGSWIQNRATAAVGEVAIATSTVATKSATTVATDAVGKVLSQSATKAVAGAGAKAGTSGLTQTATTATTVAAKTAAGVGEAAATSAATQTATKIAANTTTKAAESVAAQIASKGSVEGAETAAQQAIAKAAGSKFVEAGMRSGVQKSLTIGNGQGVLSSAKSIALHPVSSVRVGLGQIKFGMMSVVRDPAILLKAAGGRVMRGGLGTVSGAADGALAGGIQGFGYTAIEEQTWNDGFASGLGRSLSAGLHSAPMGAMFGGAFGGVMHAAITPRTIKLGQKLSLDATEAAFKDARINADGRNVLATRAEKGWVTRGDFYDAVAASKPVRDIKARLLDIAHVPNSVQQRLGRIDRSLNAAASRIEGIQAQATKEANAAKAFIEKPGITPEQKVAAEQALMRAQARLADIAPQAQEFAVVREKWTLDRRAPTRYQLEVLVNGQPKSQSTMVSKDFIETRLKEEIALQERASSGAAVDARIKARSESRVDGLMKMQEAVDAQTKFLQARAQPYVDAALVAKDHTKAAIGELKKLVSKGTSLDSNAVTLRPASKSTSEVGTVPKSTKSEYVSSEAAAIDAAPPIAKEQASAAKAGEVKVAAEPTDAPAMESVKSKEIVEHEAMMARVERDIKSAVDRGDISTAKRIKESYDELEIQLEDLKAAAKPAPDPSKVITAPKKAASQDGPRNGPEDGYGESPTDGGSGGGGSDGDFGGGWRPGNLGGGGTATAPRTSGRITSAHVAERSSSPVRFEPMESSPISSSARYLSDPQNSGPSGSRSARDGVGMDTPELQLETTRRDAALGLMDEPAPLAEEFSMYDTPEVRAYKQSQRDALDQSIEDLFSGAVEEFSVIKKAEPGQNTQLRDIIESSADIGRARSKAAEEQTVRDSEITKQELDVKRARDNEEISRKRAKDEEVDNRRHRAERAEERSDALQRAEDAPLDGIVEDTSGSKVFEETLNRLFEPAHGNQTPRMHPLEEAALAARARRIRETGDSWQTSADRDSGGVAVMEPDVVLDPRMTPERSLDPRVFNKTSVKTNSRVRPIEELKPGYSLKPMLDPRPQPQQHKVRSQLDTELEVMFRDEPSPVRRFPRFGGGGDGESATQTLERTGFVMPKHVVPIKVVEAKVHKVRSHGRRVSRRIREDGTVVDDLNMQAAPLDGSDFVQSRIAGFDRDS